MLERHPEVREAVVVARGRRGRRPAGSSPTSRGAGDEEAPPRTAAEDARPRRRSGRPSTTTPTAGARPERRRRRSIPPSTSAAGTAATRASRSRPGRCASGWSSTVERILALRPRRVLEIGCGTGLLLFRVAPRTRAVPGHRLLRRGPGRRPPPARCVGRSCRGSSCGRRWPTSGGRRRRRRSRPGRPQLGRAVLPGRRLPDAGAGGGGAVRRAGRRGLPRRPAQPAAAAGLPHLGRAVPGARMRCRSPSCGAGSATAG